MQSFIYIATNPATGERVTAEVQAENQQAAAKLLISQNLFPITIEDKKAGKGVLAGFKIGSGVKAKDRVIFTRQLATLINAGLPLDKSLETVGTQISNKVLHSAIREVQSSVEGGTTLSAAFASHPKIFNQTYVSLIAAGETSGTLDKTLERIASQQEKDAAIVSKIRGALVYPLIVLGVVIAVLVFMLTTVLPQIQQLYKDLKKTLPPVTRGLLALSNFIIHDWWVLILLLVVAGYLTRNYLRTDSGGRVADRLKLRFPILGPLLLKVYMARFSRTLGTLLQSGIPMLEALNVVRRSINNVFIQEGIDRAAEAVRGGKALSSSLEQEKYFLILVPQMIRIGEQSGALDAMLDKLASFYEGEVDQEVKNLSTTIEPALMIFLGLTVGLIVAAILLPVYSLVGKGLS